MSKIYETPPPIIKDCCKLLEKELIACTIPNVDTFHGLISFSYVRTDISGGNVEILPRIYTFPFGYNLPNGEEYQEKYKSIEKFRDITTLPRRVSVVEHFQKLKNGVDSHYHIEKTKKSQEFLGLSDDEVNKRLEREGDVFCNAMDVIYFNDERDLIIAIPVPLLGVPIITCYMDPKEKHQLIYNGGIREIVSEISPSICQFVITYFCTRLVDETNRILEKVEEDKDTAVRNFLFQVAAFLCASKFGFMPGQLIKVETFNEFHPGLELSIPYEDYTFFMQLPAFRELCKDRSESKWSHETRGIDTLKSQFELLLKHLVKLISDAKTREEEIKEKRVRFSALSKHINKIQEAGNRIQEAFMVFSELKAVVFKETHEYNRNILNKIAQAFRGAKGESSTICRIKENGIDISADDLGHMIENWININEELQKSNHEKIEKYSNEKVQEFLQNEDITKEIESVIKLLCECIHCGTSYFPLGYIYKQVSEIEIVKAEEIKNFFSSESFSMVSPKTTEMFEVVIKMKDIEEIPMGVWILSCGLLRYMPENYQKKLTWEIVVNGDRVTNKVAFDIPLEEDPRYPNLKDALAQAIKEMNDPKENLSDSKFRYWLYVLNLFYSFDSGNSTKNSLEYTVKISDETYSLP